jgi:hypothetical protein
MRKLTTFQSENFKGKPTAEPNDTAEYKTVMYLKEIRYDGVGRFERHKIGCAKGICGNCNEEASGVLLASQ